MRGSLCKDTSGGLTPAVACALRYVARCPCTTSDSPPLHRGPGCMGCRSCTGRGRWQAHRYTAYGASRHVLEWTEATLTRLLCSQGQCVMEAASGCRPPRRRRSPPSTMVWRICMRLAIVCTMVPDVERGIPWGAEGSSRPTSLSVLCNSTPQAPDAMQATVPRCWRCGVPSLTGRSNGCVHAIGNANRKRSNSACSRRSWCLSWASTERMIALRIATESIDLSKGGEHLRFCTSWPSRVENPVLDITTLISISSVLLWEMYYNAMILQMLDVK